MAERSEKLEPNESYKAKLRSADQKHAPPLYHNHGINRDGHKFMNWVGEYTYGSIQPPWSEVQINFMLDKCMYINNRFFFEQGQTYGMETLKRHFQEDSRSFTSTNWREGEFSKIQWYECTYRFELNPYRDEDEPDEETIKWPRLVDLFQPISNDECQRDFIREPHYNNDESKYEFKQCLQEKYRHVFRHKYEEEFEIPFVYDYSQPSTFDIHEHDEQLKKWQDVPDSERYVDGTAHEFIFAHDRDAMGKIQAEIDEVQRVWLELCKK